MLKTSVRILFPLLIILFAVVFSVTTTAADPPSRPGLTAEHGQIWQTYDISRYTAHVENTKNPETAVREWILLETGVETWHSEIPAMLTVTPTQVMVYHTPAVQSKVAEIVARFVNIHPDEHLFRVRLFTVGSPLWRQKVSRELAVLPSFSVGTQAWTIAPEDIKAVATMFESQPNYMLLSTQASRVVNGQANVINVGRTRTYTRNHYPRPGTGKGSEPENITLEDGFIFEVMPLLTLDGGTVDAQLKCRIDHLDRFIPLYITPPGGMSRRDDQKIAVPIVGQYRFQERYRWDSGKSLLVSLGVTPTPIPTGTESRPGLGIMNTAPTLEMLVLIEYRNVKLEQ